MGSNTSKANKITAHDKAILDLKVQRDKLKQYNKRLNLVVAKELQIAKTHLAKGDKKRALLALRRKKFQEGLLEKTELQMTNLDELTFSIEQALVEQQVVAGLAAGNQVLKELHKEMSLSDVEKLMEETAEGIAYQNEIDEILCTRLSVAEEEDIERELDEMLGNELPNVPTKSESERLAEAQLAIQNQDDELAEVPERTAPKKVAKATRTLNAPILKLWLKAQSEADQLVETMAAQTSCVIDGLRPCRRREKTRKRRAQRQRQIRPHLHEDIDGGASAGGRVEYDDELIINEIWRRHQRQQERSDMQDPTTIPAHGLHTNGRTGECIVEGDNGGGTNRGRSPDDSASERLWEFVAGWCLIGCIITGTALILGATLRAQNGVSPDTPWSIDTEDGDSLIDIVVAHIMKIALGIKDFGDKLMEHGIFVFVTGINGFVLVRQRVFVRRRLYESELMHGDIIPAEIANKERNPDEEQQISGSLDSQSLNVGHDEGAGDFYAHVEMMQSNGFLTMEDTSIAHTTPETKSHLSTTRTREIQNCSKDQQEGNDDSPDFRTMSFLAWFNYLQVGILVIEFLQLFSFPLRELIEFYNQSEKTNALYDNARSVLTILGAAGSLPDQVTPLGNTVNASSIVLRHSLDSNNTQGIISLDNATALAAPWINNITASAEWISDNLPAWLPNITTIIANGSLSLSTQDNLEEMRDQIVNMAAEIATKGWSLPGTNVTKPENGPLDDILKPTSTPKKMAVESDIVMQVVNSLGLQPSINTHDWYLLRFWSCFAAVILGWLVALSIHGWNRRCRRLRREGNSYWPAISVGWSVLYLPILSTFLSSAACQSQAIQAHAHERFIQQQEQARREGNNTLQTTGGFNSIIISLLDPASAANSSASSLLCTGPQIQPSLYLAASLIAYTLAYLLFMVFLTSFERVPAKGEICFKPNGVAVLKNLGLLLAVDFLLIQSPSQRRFRGLVSMAIMLAMACYTIRMKPCYWNKINYWRTFSFSCVLYASLLVALLCPAPEPDKVKGDRIGGKWVMAPHLNMGHAWTIGGGPKMMLAWIAAGWAILIIVFVVVDRVFLRHWIQKKNIQKAVTETCGFRPEGRPRAGLFNRQDQQDSQEERSVAVFDTQSIHNISRTTDGLPQNINPRRSREATAADGTITNSASGSHWSIVDLACDNDNVSYYR
ncbi:Vacuolar protein sorting-associated protein 20 [Mortierella sp. AM989]|nr:Vacuolar protein sorting-associated protein 20 [Mortierella sp. AM989]